MAIDDKTGDSDNVVSLDRFRQQKETPEDCESLLPQIDVSEEQLDSLLNNLDELLASIKDPDEPEYHHYTSLHAVLRILLDNLDYAQDSPVAEYDDDVKMHLFYARDHLYKVGDLIKHKLPRE